MILFITKIYSAVYVYLANNFRINIRGFGFLLRSISKDYILKVQGNKIYLDSRISTSYARLIIGKWNEDETHVFARRFAEKFKRIVFFDIGANIGEMVVDFASLDEFKTVVAFEPDPLCARNVKINALLNNREAIIVENLALSNKNHRAFLENGGTPQASISDKKNSPDDAEIQVVMFDEYISKNMPDICNDGEQMLILIDVEGSELAVLEGAVKSIEQYNPVIIFEYNAVSKKHFNLDQISQVLGSRYCIRRLNQRGGVDDNLDDTWNCIAIPQNLVDVV
tara:strand:+ start:48943 stop:49785 length:843 start_codon:yes stop_codon:yes gene_type:complete